MNISVIGTGYVGLVTGTCFAELGMNVTCVDKDEDKINSLKSFLIPIYEIGLEAIVTRNYIKDRLRFTSNIKEAVEEADTIFISVGTPSLKDGTAELKYIFKAAKEIAEFMESYKLIIIKSTVPIGTCQRVKNKIEKVLKKRKSNIEFDIVSNPEFLREGSGIKDFFNPDRIVIGTESEKAACLMKSIYEDHVFRNTPLIFTNLETAEMIKYASNAFLATKISFINEIANICELCGADIKIVAKAMGLDKRIGSKFLNPGPGFGGSCFPKDINALIKIGEDLGYKPKIIERVMKSNLEQKKRALQMITNIVGEVRNKTFTVLGLAFKAETDDIRESPSIYIIKALLKNEGKVKAFDPKAMENTKKIYPELDISYCEDEYSACQESDCIILATEWEQFGSLDFTSLKSIVKSPVFIDLKNMYEPNDVKAEGFSYKGVGRQ
jgi:UDPglucose 6-dehydrogenase